MKVNETEATIDNVSDPVNSEVNSIDSAPAPAVKKKVGLFDVKDSDMLKWNNKNMETTYFDSEGIIKPVYAEKLRDAVRDSKKEIDVQVDELKLQINELTEGIKKQFSVVEVEQQRYRKMQRDQTLLGEQIDKFFRRMMKQKDEIISDFMQAVNELAEAEENKAKDSEAKARLTKDKKKWNL